METTTNNTNNMETTTNNEIYTGTKGDYELMLEMIGNNQKRVMELEAELKHMRDTYGDVIDGEAGAKGKVDDYKSNAFAMLKSLATMLAKQEGTTAVLDAIVESVNGDTADEYMREYANDFTNAHDVFNNAKKYGFASELAEMLLEEGYGELEWDVVDNWLDENIHNVADRVIEKFDADDLIDHVVDNCNQKDLIDRIDTGDIIDYVFDNCNEHQLFDRVQSFVADLDDSQFRKIING